MNRTGLAGWAVVVGAFASGCSSSSSGVGGGASDAAIDVFQPAADSGPGEAGDAGQAPDAADAAPAPSTDGGCSTLVDTAPVVQEQAVATAPPTAKGGTFPSGLFYVTAATVYTGVGGSTGASGASIQVTAYITDGEFFQISANSTGPATDPDVFAGESSGSFALNGGAKIGIAALCPGVFQSAVTTFDTDGTTYYTTYAPVSASATYALTYTKQ